MMSFGRMISARAMAMRWRWPPENSWMYFSASARLQPDLGQRRRDRARAARRRAAASSSRWNGSATSRATRWRGLKLP